MQNQGVAGYFVRTEKSLRQFPDINLAAKSAREAYIACSGAAVLPKAELRLLISVQPGYQLGIEQLHR